MAFRRRRRRARVNWFPIIGTEIGQTNRNNTVTTFSIPIPPTGDPDSLSKLEVPLTFDFGQEFIIDQALQGATIPTLADLTGSSWRCRRIVGKIWAAYETDARSADQNLAAPGVVVSAGLMVRNVDESGFQDPNSVNPLETDDSTDPWIWRRCWILGSGATTGTSEAETNGVIRFLTNAPADNFISPNNRGFTNFPNTNIQGSVLDGPHVDAKTNRVIGPEQRLFLEITATPLPLQVHEGTHRNTSVVIGAYDLRLLGSLQRASNRRNAAR